MKQVTINRLLSKLQYQLPKAITPPEGKVFIFPFNITLGTTNSSEIGTFTENLEPADFGSFEKIFSGQDSVLIQWEGSTTLKKEQPTDTFLTKQYKAGVFRTGQIIATTKTAQFATSLEDTDFIAQRINKVIKIRFQNYNPQDIDFFKFYIIPQSNSSNIFYISNVEVFKDLQSNTFLYSEITFSNIKDEISKSGRSINNFIQFSAAGEEYAYPELHFVNGAYEVRLDRERLLARPVDEIQIEFYGNVILMGLYCMGRRTVNVFNDTEKDWESNKQMNAPHFLFNYSARTPQIDEYARTSGSENTYYAIIGSDINGVVDITTFWDDWRDKIAAIADYTKTKNYEGVILTNIKDVQDTNKTGADFWTTSLRITVDQDLGKNGFNPYIKGSTTLNDDYTVHDYLNFISISTLEVEKLPIQLSTSTIWSLKNVPLIGGFLNGLTLGLVPSWANNDIKIPAKPISGFISKHAYDFGAAGVQSLEGRLPMELFKNETEDSIGGIIGTNSITTAYRFKLTDKVLHQGVNKDTLDLGQTATQGWKMDETTKAQDPALTDQEGFIIDLINLKVIGKCDYKITAFRQGQKVYSSKYQTRAKFSDTIREISNTIKLSNWEEESGQVINYPEAIVPPPPAVGDKEPREVVLNLKHTSKIGTREDTGATTLDSTFEKLFYDSLDDLKTKGFKTMSMELSSKTNVGSSKLTGLMSLADIIWEPVGSKAQSAFFEKINTQNIKFSPLYKNRNDGSYGTPADEISVSILQNGIVSFLERSDGLKYLNIASLAFDFFIAITPPEWELVSDPEIYKQENKEVFVNELTLVKLTIF